MLRHDRANSSIFITEGTNFIIIYINDAARLTARKNNIAFMYLIGWNNEEPIRANIKSEIVTIG